MASASPQVLDARLLPCTGKHTLIFRRWAELAVGESLVLLNDHRPEPLRRQFEQAVPGCCDWRELPPPPGAFAVRLTRLKPDPADFEAARIGGCGALMASGEEDLFIRLQLDYRDLPSSVAGTRVLHAVHGMAEGTELQVDLIAADPALDAALTGLGLTFRGTPLSPEVSGWRYRIRHPVVPSV